MKRLRDKMYDWEANPPAPVWDRVRAALDESESAAAFPGRLHEWEAEPPAHAWAAIAASLDTATEEATAPVITIRRSRTTWMRYAAAVLVLAVAGFGIRFLTLNNDSTLAVAPAVPAAKNAVPEVKPTNNLPALGDHASNDSLKNSLPNTLPTSRPFSSREELQFASEANQDYADEMDKTLYAYEDHQPRIAEKYVTLMIPQGSFIRMSKKWSHLLCCIAGEDPNAACNMQLKAWQDQLAESPVAPAPGNFMDLLDLVNSVSEGTQL